jgi:hypothetical protein
MVIEMKPRLALLAISLLSVCICACGGGGGRADTTASSASVASTNDSTTTASTESPLADIKADSDKDNDVGAPGDDKQNTSALGFGHAASPSEQRAITALVKRYYAAGFAENGAKACSMIYSTLAESIPEDYSQTPGVPYMRGAKTCSASMTLFFRHYHPLLALEIPKLKVVRVRIEEHHGLVLLSFGTLPEREIYVSRERHVWKMTGLLDVELE